MPHNILSFFKNWGWGITKSELKQNGIAAEAIVLDISLEGKPVNESQKVIIQIQVQPERARNFVTEINDQLSIFELAALNAGTRISVFYNPNNLKEVIFHKVA